MKIFVIYSHHYDSCETWKNLEKVYTSKKLAAAEFARVTAAISPANKSRLWYNMEEMVVSTA